MKLLLCHPGATWAVADVWRGYRNALKRAGHEVIDYALNGRLAAARGWLDYCWKKSGLPKEQHPQFPDYLYAAGMFILEKALWHRPDWVLVIAAMYLHPRAIVLMRRAGVRVAVMLTESPYDDENQKRIASLCNAVFTNERTSVETFREVCPSSHYLAHAYDPEVHYPHSINGDTPKHDVLFVGTGFQERVEMLRAVSWKGIDFGLYGSWELLGSRNRLRQYLRDGLVDNGKTADMYQAAKVGLNIHRTSIGMGRKVNHITHAESVNPRVFELAASGCFFVSDRRAELTELFGEIVPTFENAAQLQEEVRYWVNTPEEERQFIAQQARQAVQGQTFDARARQLITVLEQT